MDAAINPAGTSQPERPAGEGTKPYLQATIWLARNFSQPVAPAAIEQKMPAGYARMGTEIMPRLLQTVGLKAAFSKSVPAKADPVVLPAVIFDRGGNPAVLKDISNRGKTFHIIRFEAGQTLPEETLDAAELKQNYLPDLLLVSVESDILTARQDRSAAQQPVSGKDWFWTPVRRHWGDWFQIIIAALGINILGLALPIFVMNVYDRVIPNLALVTLWSLAAGVGIALLLDLILKIVRTTVLERAGRRIDLTIAADLFSHAMNIRMLERRGGAPTIASQIRDFETVREFFTSNSFVAVVDLFFVGIFIFVLWMIVGPIAIVPLLAVPLVIIIALISQVPISASIELLQQVSAKKHLVLMETLLGIETVKSVNGEPLMQREWERAVAASSRISGKTRFWSNFAISSTMMIQQSVSVVIILWGVYLVSAGEITIGGLIAANILAGRVLAPLGNISQTLVRAQQALSALSAISDYMKLPVEATAHVRSELEIERGDVEMQNVTLTYPGSQVEALSEFSLKTGQGDTIGILGRVGSGKTTIGKLIAGLIHTDSGIILVDGHEIQQYEPAVLRTGIGYLPQDPEMFTGTIRENVTIGKPGASDEEINRALYFSGMDYFVSENPEGLNQFVGEKGNRLSGGQRQSISLARLILRQPKLLFLDEPTNAMDHNTEAVVTARLKELNDAGTTLIIATHRHSLTAILDRLIVVDKGRKILDGPRDKVLVKLSQPQNGK